MQKLAWLSIFVITVWGLWGSYAPISRAPGVLIQEEPLQVALPANRPPVEHGKWTLKLLATYDIKARVLSKESYSTDLVAELAPCDLAVGWGRMSDSAVLDHLTITQRYRRFAWMSWTAPPIPEKEITCHAANMHLIPASESVLNRLASVRKGSLVRMSGYLVEATMAGQRGAAWKSSLTRSDSGDGACEIMLVQSITEMD